ncbi:MAG: MFS transporter [Deltaproteobacteria bacterium]|nr:MFS transporter [Deltaproteobacteria bacterium]
MASGNPFAALNGMQRTFRALHHRNYRLFFGGQSISLIGTWMQQLAMSWLTYRLTHSTVLLGVVGFSSLIPSFLLAPFAGVLIDRWERYRVMIVTQILAMIQAVVLALLVLTGMITIWHIIILSTLLGIINSVDNPVRHALIIDLVESKEDLSNAIALSASMFNVARLVGPSIAGVLISLVGEGVCFLINALSFIAVIISLLSMKVTSKERKMHRTPFWQDIREGFAYAFGFPPIRYILMLIAWTSLVGMSYNVLMPVFARDILHGGAHTFGFLMAGTGCGALIGSIYLATRKSVLNLERILVITSLLFGIGLILLSLSHVDWIALIFMMLIGFGMISQFAGCNTILQTIVEEDKRGRVMSLFIMTSIGTIPFGSLLAGSMAQIVGTPQTIRISGLLCIFGAVMLAVRLHAFRAMIHPIYIKKGIIMKT